MKEIYEWLYDEYAEAALCQEPLFRDHVLEEVLAAAHAAQREGGADNQGKGAYVPGYPARLLHRVGDAGARHVQADADHGLLEQVAVLPAVNGVRMGADHAHVLPLQHAAAVELHGAVQGRLAAQGGEQGVRLFPDDDFLHELRGDRFNVGARGGLRVRHDGGGIGVYQHYFITFFPEGLAGLGAGVVEFAALADDDRAGADHENLFDGGIFRHNGDGRILWFWTVDFRRGELSARRAPEESFFTANDADFSGVGGRWKTVGKRAAGTGRAKAPEPCLSLCGQRLAPQGAGKAPELVGAP